MRYTLPSASAGDAACLLSVQEVLEYKKRPDAIAFQKAKVCTFPRVREEKKNSGETLKMRTLNARLESAHTPP